ncbi:MAG: PIN domain-containing protein [Hyphomicrobiaceae bacterium]
MASPIRCFLDANVLFSAAVRDLVVQLGVDGLLDLRWSDAVQDEWTYALALTRPDLSPERLARTRLRLEAALPVARVANYEHLISTLVLPDPNDRHVLAAAMTAEASMILTFNLADFPRTSIPPVHPDQLLTTLAKATPVALCATIKTVRTRLANPPTSPTGYLDILRRNQLPLLADELAVSTGIF